MTDPAPATTFIHLDATTVLARSLAAKGIYPAVDVLESTSTMLQPWIVGDAHSIVWAHEHTRIANLVYWKDKPVALSIVQRLMFTVGRLSSRSHSRWLESKAACYGFSTHIPEALLSVTRANPASSPIRNAGCSWFHASTAGVIRNWARVYTSSVPFTAPIVLLPSPVASQVVHHTDCGSVARS